MVEPEVWQIGDKEYVTPQDAARYLACSVFTIKEFIRKGKIEYITVESHPMVEWQSLQTVALFWQRRTVSSRKG